MVPATSKLLDAAREAGADSLVVGLPATAPDGGVALEREWIADWAQNSFRVQMAGDALDALILDSPDPSKLMGVLTAALRLDLPVVVASSDTHPFAVALAAMGFAPVAGDAAEVAVEVARNGGPRPRKLVEGFSLANALRAGLAAGAEPELLVHLAAVAREAGVVGFSRMIRVLVPESPALAGPFETANLLASLGDDLHDVPTIEGRKLKEALPEPPEARPEEKDLLRFVAGRASGTEAVAQAPRGVEEIAGTCRVFGSEDEAMDAVARESVAEDALLVVAGVGARGGPGLVRMDRLGETMREVGLDVAVITDGLPPDVPPGASPWVSLFSPEAAAGGVIGDLRDGDFLRFDLAEGRIRTNVPADEFDRREPFSRPEHLPAFGYAARYARTALPALDGAGFGE